MLTNSKTANITDIISLNHDGRGVAHINGKITFIEGALPKEKVSFVYTRRHATFDEAKTLEVFQQSPLRVVPLCPHFGVCGGCSLQHLEHQAQLDLKQKVILEQLAHIGKVAPQKILPPLVSSIWSYRYKARLSVKYVAKKNKVLVGFHEKKGRFVTDTKSCPILHKAFSDKINELSLLIASLDNYQHIPQIEIACSLKQHALVIRHLREFNSQDLDKLKQFAKQNDYYLLLQPAGLDSVHCITHEIKLLDYSVPLGQDELKLYFKPTDFTQINYQINQQLVARVLELLSPQPQENILDLYCGIGNFTLPLAKYCRNCVGVEGNNEAVQRAALNAEANKINNTEFYCADLSNPDDYLGQAWAKMTYDKILLDPPRTGALDCVMQLKKFMPQKIVYVSCNPATLARDSAEIVKQGYILTSAGLMDMFPHTSHAEAIAVFERA